MAKLFLVTGGLMEVKPEDGKEFSLTEIKRLVEDTKGDGIDGVRVSDSLNMFVRENSFWELPVNVLATDYIQQFRPDYRFKIHGSALVCDLVESGDSENEC